MVLKPLFYIELHDFVIDGGDLDRFVSLLDGSDGVKQFEEVIRILDNVENRCRI